MVFRAFRKKSALVDALFPYRHHFFLGNLVNCPQLLQIWETQTDAAKQNYSPTARLKFSFSHLLLHCSPPSPDRHQRNPTLPITMIRGRFITWQSLMIDNGPPAAPKPSPLSDFTGKTCLLPYL